MQKKTVSEVLSDLLNETAERLGKPRSELVPWIDFDPIFLDETARRHCEPGVRWAGD